MKIQKNYLYDYDISVDVDAFYKDLNEFNIQNLNALKIAKLKAKSNSLNKLFNNVNYANGKKYRYSKLMNEIRVNPKKHDILNPTDKFLLFMFSVDPNFEIATTFDSLNIDEAKKEIKNIFGIYDKNLLKIELLYVRNFVSKQTYEKLKLKKI